MSDEPAQTHLKVGTSILPMSQPAKNILTVVQGLTLDAHQKDLFHIHYLNVLHAYRRRANLYAAIFHLSRAIVTVGSITVPALLSLSDADKWLTWSISLAVSICNGILTLFKVDKKYYSLHTTWRVLESEGWQYIALTGRYSKSRDPTNTHKSQFTSFTLAIEKIRMAQVEDEYYKAQQDAQHDKHAANPGQKTLVPTATAPKSQEEKQEVDDWVGQMLDDAKSDAKNSIAPPPRDQLAGGTAKKPE